MRYQALKKKTFLAAVTFTGIAVLFPVLCMAASENDVQTYTDTDFAMDTVVSETLYTTGDDINSKLTAVLTDVDTLSGSTFSSTGILNAVDDALGKAENS